MILSIETATRICSVALFSDNKIIGCLESEDENAHSRILHILIDRLFKESGTSMSQLDAVAVSKGPGSYTGLRIGVSTAKGLCYGRDIPVIAVNSLEALAYGMRAVSFEKGTDSNTLFIPMIDARRIEVFTAIYNSNLETIRETSAEIITTDSLTDYSTYHLVLGGDGADTCHEILNRDNITILPHFNASAANLLIPAQRAMESRQFENTAYFEPFYLKDFIAGKSHVKGLK